MESRDQFLECLGVHAIAPLFNETMDDLIASSSDSSSSASSSSDEEDETAQIINAIDTVSSTRYLEHRRPIPKSGAILDLCLKVYRPTRPKQFRKFARMEPEAFDVLVQALENEDIFYNSSSNSFGQIPVERQLLIALIRFGSYGNGASLAKIASLCGVGTGTVELVTRRVISAVKSSNLRQQHVRWPTGLEKEAAKEWVERQVGVAAWRDGFCMVDGTLIPLYEKPTHYGETFFDRKMNYSINVQIVNTPNRQIIDYASGFRGSRHDNYCFQFTKLSQNRTELLEEGEWCWADQGYHLAKWLILPYKQPANNLRENRTFNFHLSTIRIRCEHTIGYLKGRFQSLKELRVRIRNAKDLAYATAWINTCIILHAFCIDQELDTHWDWLRDGQRFEQNWHAQSSQMRETDRSKEIERNEGKQVREDLKKSLLEALD